MTRAALVSLLLVGCGFPPVFVNEESPSEPSTVFSTPQPSSGGRASIIDIGSGGFGTGGGYGGSSFQGDPCKEAGFSCTNTRLCASAFGVPICTCPPGSVGPHCEERSSCSNLSCGDNAECIQFEHGADCTCRFGYEQQAGGCVDIDECQAGLDLCDANASCLNTLGGYQCICESGVGDGFFFHADECATNPCVVGSCILTPQSYACECPAGTGGPNCSIDCSGPLTFDPVIESSLRQMLAKVTGDILAEDLAGRTYIDVWGKGVQSLAGFECWPDLESANLGLGQITDISPLKDLAKLSSLVLTCNPITDLSPLANLPRLSTLFIGDLPDCGADLPLDNAVSLSLAQGLTVLQIERRNVPSLEFVRTLPRLSRLGLVKAGLSDISGLSRLGTLLSLDLRDNELSDLSEIAQLAQLIELDLSNNPRAIAESLSTRPLPCLTRLRLAGTGISDLAAIAGLSQVDHFELSNNQITDLTPFLQNERFGWAGSLELANNPFKCSRVLPQAYALAGRGIKVSGIERCITKQ